MSVVKCKNCGKEISKKASICPNCGVKMHPIRDIVKIVIIVLVVILVLGFGLYAFSGGLSEAIEKAKEEAPAKKFYGTWELVSKNDNAENYSYNSSYDIYDTIEITGINNFHSWYNKDKDFIVTCVGKDSSSESVACFRLDGDYLIQEDCGDFSVGEYIMKNTELKYKKVK